ncbi:MAG: hypothetical protein KKI20_03835, partial [Gammaproteobacteria bacterium]|nr:hypothetical protein [Gammaproteobacteria bacterium]
MNVTYESQLKETPRSRALNLLQKINPTSQLPGYIEELFSDSPNIDCFLRHLISAVVIPSDERKRALAT